MHRKKNERKMNEFEIDEEEFRMDDDRSLNKVKGVQLL